MSPLDAKLTRILKEDHVNRIKQSLGLDKFEKGKINIVEVVEKYEANRKAKREGRLDDVKVINLVLMKVLLCFKLI